MGINEVTGLPEKRFHTRYSQTRMTLNAVKAAIELKWEPKNYVKVPENPNLFIVTWEDDDRMIKSNFDKGGFLLLM